MSASPDIFLSYNREDAEVARRFAEGFEAQGFDVWWDQALRSGEAYDEVTERALNEAKAVVVLWSPGSVVSRWVRAEATTADRNHTLVPAIIEPCNLPVMFQLTQTADLTSWQSAADDTAWLAFLGDVRRMLGEEGPAPESKAGAVSTSAGAGIPIVAVMPITIRGSDEELEILAEDLTEEITRELSRGSYFKVTAAGITAAWRGKAIDYRALGRELGARYLVEGKLQRVGENIRLTVQVIESATGNMSWSQRFVRKADEVEPSLEEFAAAVVAELDQLITQIEQDRAMAKSVHCSSWEHMLRSIAYHSRLGTERVRRASEESHLAVSMAPDFGLAHAHHALALSLHVITEGEELDDALSREIRAHVTRALELDGNNPRVIAWLVMPYAALGDGEIALRLARRAMKLDPNSSNSYIQLGFAYMVVGRIGDAVTVYEQQDRRTFHDDTRHSALANLGRCYLLEGKVDEAVDRLDRALALSPDYSLALKWKAIASAQRGDDAAAHENIKRLREAEPTKTIDHHVRQMLFYSRLADRLAEHVETFRRLWDETEGDR